MYSHEDRLRAVELYFKCGKKVVQIVRELGYPPTKQLRRWVQAWQTRDVLVERVRRKPRYTDMQKHAAVEHYLKQGCCQSTPVISQLNSSDVSDHAVSFARGQRKCPL